MAYNRFQGSEHSKIIRAMEKRLNMSGAFHTPLLVRDWKNDFLAKWAGLCIEYGQLYQKMIAIQFDYMTKDRISHI